MDTVLTNQVTPDSTPPKSHKLPYDPAKIRQDPTLILKHMVPARTHPAAKKHESTKKLEKELAYYMGEIEKKFQKSEIRTYKFKRAPVKEQPIASRSQPPPPLYHLRTSNST
jgi:hypothetical protein